MLSILSMFKKPSSTNASVKSSTSSTTKNNRNAIFNTHHAEPYVHSPDTEPHISNVPCYWVRRGTEENGYDYTEVFPQVDEGDYSFTFPDCDVAYADHTIPPTVTVEDLTDMFFSLSKEKKQEFLTAIGKD